MSTDNHPSTTDALSPSEWVDYQPELHGECEIELMRITRMRVRLGERSDWPPKIDATEYRDLVYQASRRPALIEERG